MITKILLTLTVIVGAALFLRIKANRNGEGRRVVTRTPASAKPSPPSEREKLFRQAAWLFMLLMATSAIVMVVYELGEQYATVRVHVVNTQTGERTSYQAEQKDIKSNQFTTLEGKTVYIADVERLEIDPE